MAEMLVIETHGLTKTFGDVKALSGVDLRLPIGGVLALLGPNGAGKTTAVRILTTLLSPDGGSARVMGFDVVDQPGAVRRVVGLSGQNAAVDPYLSGEENLRMIGRLSGLRPRAAGRRAEELLELFELTDVATRTARTYSGGMRRRLDVAASLVARPEVIFLDEPTTGLDPRGRLGLWAQLEALTAQGTSILLTTQYLEEADRMADTIVVIDQGRVIAAGTSDELKAEVGGDRLELQVPPDTDPWEMARVIAGVGSGPPMVDDQSSRVVLPVANGPAVLADVASRLDASHLTVSDLMVRRPSLDDVFLALTGEQMDPSLADMTSPRSS